MEAYLTDTRKIIVAQIDGRGTGYLSNEYMFEVYRNLGTIEIQDIINITKFLIKKYNCIDDENIGIWGKGYGGYLTTMTLEDDPDSVFKCGISGISHFKKRL